MGRDRSPKDPGRSCLQPHACLTKSGECFWSVVFRHHKTMKTTDREKDLPGCSLGAAPLFTGKHNTIEQAVQPRLKGRKLKKEKNRAQTQRKWRGKSQRYGRHVLKLTTTVPLSTPRTRRSHLCCKAISLAPCICARRQLRHEILSH